MDRSVPLQVNTKENSHGGMTLFVIFPVIVYVAIHDKFIFHVISFFSFVDSHLQILSRFAFGYRVFIFPEIQNIRSLLPTQY